MGDWLEGIIERHRGITYPKDNDYIVVDIHGTEGIVERNFNLRALHMWLKGTFKSEGAPLILITRNAKVNPNEYEVEFWPKEALSKRGFRVETHFLRERYAEAAKVYQEAVRGLLEEMKYRLCEECGVVGHKNAEKCWELSCVRSKSGDLSSIARRFEEYSLLLT